MAEKGFVLIHYHGGPITPLEAGYAAWKRAHALVSYFHPAQCRFAAENAHSFVLDNGAFSAWKARKLIDFSGYAEWVEIWRQHHGFDWCLIPDVIDGDWETNAKLIDQWGHSRFISVPIWHLHEPLEWLAALVAQWPRVAIGSSGQWSTPGTEGWWHRISEAMEVACDSHGRPLAKLHGLRMLDPTIFSHLPLASGDSATVAVNVGLDERAKVRWGDDPFPPLTKDQRAVSMRNNIEHHASAPRWVGRGVQKNFELVG